MSAQTAVGWATRETEVILIHPGIEPFVGLGAGGHVSAEDSVSAGGKGAWAPRWSLARTSRTIP